MTAAGQVPGAVSGVPLVLATLFVYGFGYALGLLATVVVRPDDPKPVRWMWTALYLFVSGVSAVCANGAGWLSWLLVFIWSVLSIVLLANSVRRRSLIRAAKAKHPTADDGPLAW